MPVHIDNSNRKRNPLLGKMLHHVHVRIFCILIISAPPVTKGISGNHGHPATYLAEIAKPSVVVLSIAKKVNVNCAFLPINKLTIFNNRSLAVVNSRIAISAKNALLKPYSTIRIIKSSGCSAQITPVGVAVTIVPDNAIFLELYRKPIG